jgi:hypothetical protein
MKLIEVSSDYDYGATMFEQSFQGTNTKVSDFIADHFDEDQNVIDYEFEHYDCNPVTVQIELYEFREVDLKFVEFIRRDFVDYDYCKCHNFYLENEILNG